MDYFAFLGLPRTLNIAPADLDQRYRTLSRQLHPDYFQNASPAERRASLERTSYLNDAYRTLKNPALRIEYLLTIEGMSKTADGGAVPAALLEDVFALNEELDDIRAARARGAAEDEWKPRLARARVPIEQKRREYEADLESLSAKWDAAIDSGADGRRAAVLEALRDRLLERKYIANLLDAIERESN